MPPLVLLSLVGPAIALHNSETLHRAFPDRFYVSPNLERVVAAGKRAIYGPDGEVDPEVADLYETGDVELTADQVRERVLSALAEEARLMLDDGVVVGPEDIDLGMIMGAGFLGWNGGLTMLLDRTGISEKVTGKKFH
jgi:3-hydroxyacyl-CoA dehydrogenase